jgi:hypothetical protein
MYTIVAGIPQTRTGEGIDNETQATQYGFRAKRSTTQAIYIVRRAIDMAERAGTQLFTTFLDWEKAFDRIKQNKIVEALQRIGIPED